MRSLSNLWHCIHIPQERCSFWKIPARQLADYYRMYKHVVSFQLLLESRFRVTQVVDPHRRVYQNHQVSSFRRRGMFSISGALPPVSPSHFAASDTLNFSSTSFR